MTRRSIPWRHWIATALFAAVPVLAHANADVEKNIADPKN